MRIPFFCLWGGKIFECCVAYSPFLCCWTRITAVISFFSIHSYVFVEISHVSKKIIRICIQSVYFVFCMVWHKYDGFVLCNLDITCFCKCNLCATCLLCVCIVRSFFLFFISKCIICKCSLYNFCKWKLRRLYFLRLSIFFSSFFWSIERVLSIVKKKCFFFIHSAFTF